MNIRLRNWVIVGVIGLSALLVFGYPYYSPLFIDVKVNESLEDITNSQSQKVSPTTQTPSLTEPVNKVTPAPTTTTPVTPPEEMKVQTVSSGTFEGRVGHNAGGTATLLKINEKHYVRFESDFSVTNGPDLYVYLGKSGSYDPAAELAVLKGNIGSQNYEIPDSIKITDYNEVWVWCKQFSVPFGVASLK